MKGEAIPNHRRRKGKRVESNTNLAVHNETFNNKDN
jgi:hypothetical protein